MKHHWLISKKNFFGVLIFLAIIFPIIILGLFGYKNRNQEIIKFALSQKSSLAHLSAITLKERFDRVKDVSVSLATRPKVQQLIQQGKWEEAIKFLEGVLQNFPLINRILLADPQGVLRADISQVPEVKGMSFAHRDWYKGVIRTESIYISEIYTRTAEPRFNVVAIASPIRNEEGKMIGILVMQIKLETFLEWSKDIDAGQNGLVYFVDHKGQLAGHPEFAVQAQIIDYSKKPTTQKILKGEEGIELLYDSLEKEEQIVAYEPVPEYNWGVVVEQPVRVALAAFNSSLRNVALIYGLIFFLSCLGANLILRNTTKIKQVEEENRNLFTLSLDMLCIAGFDGYFKRLGPSWEKTRGFTMEKLCAKPFIEFIHPEDREKTIAEAQKLSTGIDVISFENRYLCKNGSYRWILWNATSSLKEELIFASARDVTEKKRAEAEIKKVMEQTLIESEEKYRELVNEVNDGFFVVDKEGVFGFVNKALAKMMGCKYPEELIGKKFLEFIAPDSLEEVLNHFKNQMEGKRVSETVNVKIIGLSGKEIYVEVRPSPIYEDGKIIGSRGVIRDITERKQLEQQLRQSQKMEAVGKLAGGIAHDFNNLLTVILGYSQIIHNRLPEDDPLLKDIDEVRKSAIRAASLTKQLLAFSRKQVLQPKKINLNSVVIETEKMLGRLIGENIELVTETSPMLGPVMADPGQIEQVIMNLVVNARDAMEEGGKLTIETANVILDENYARLNPGAKPGHYAMLAVTDTGSGMDNETLSHLFEPFFNTKAPGKGTGLRLSTVYGIIKQSGGYISAYSEVNKGTSFKVYLPLVSGTPQAAEANKTGKIVYKPSETILLAEDEETVRALAFRILSDQGYKVLETGEPLQAVQIFNNYKGKIDLIITDIIMPGMTGLGLVQRIQTTHPDVKVLYISGYTDTSMLHQGVLESDTPFLQKPFTPQTLLKKVREVILDTNIVSPQ